MSADSKSIKTFTKSELFEYTKSNNSQLIISIHENVYDVTKFADEHPGGEEVLKEHQIRHNAFIDATEAFEDVGHSMDARDLLKKYQIGKLASAQSQAPKKAVSADKKDEKCTSCWYWYLIPIVIAASAVYFYKFR